MNADSTSIWFVVLTSAAIGAVISSVINVIGQFIERSARRREMLLKSAIEHAWRFQDHLLKMARDSGRAIQVVDPIVNAEEYYQWLQHLYKNGKLPEHPTLAKTKKLLKEQAENP